MKKHELLKYAYDNYPKDVEVKSALTSEEFIACGKYEFGATGGISDHETGLMIYSVINNCKWAEIIVNDGMGENAKSPGTTSVPVKILTSEDGVDLHDGDNYHRVWLDDSRSEWKYDFCTDLKDHHAVCRNDEFSAKAKAFSTKEAAQSWIDEQNKPQAIDVKLFNRTDRAVVVKTGVTISIGGTLVTLAHSDIEDIHRAIQSLQCDTNKS